MIKHIVAAICFMALIAAIILFSPTKSDGQWYDCRLAEISPDYPQEVKDACRKIRGEQIRNQKEIFI